MAQQYNRELTNARQEELGLYDQQLVSLREQINQLQELSSNAEESQSIRNIQDQVRSVQAARISLLQSLVESGSSADRTQTALRQTALVVDVAPLPQKPVSNRTTTVLAAGVVGIVMGIGLTLLLDYLDTSVRVRDTLATVYGRSVLAVIGRNAAGRSGPSLLLDEKPSQLHAAFDTLQLAVQALDHSASCSSLLITSAVSGEGKTFVAANVALSLARSGKRVILVDADLRTSPFQRLFILSSTLGLTDLLSNDRDRYDLDDVLCESSFAHLSILMSGHPVAQPAALFSSQAMSDTLCRLAERADIVGIDAPPIVGVSDAFALAAKVDGVLQVVRAGKTRLETVLRAKATLESVQATIVGVVLNGADTGEGRDPAAYRQRLYASALTTWRWLIHRRKAAPVAQDQKPTAIYLVRPDEPVHTSPAVASNGQSSRSSKHKGRSLNGHRQSK